MMVWTFSLVLLANALGLVVNPVAELVSVLLPTWKRSNVSYR